MDRCRKCHKPLILGPAACSSCGEPLFGMQTVGVFNATPTTVNTFSSGEARELEAPTQQLAYQAPTYTSTAHDGMATASGWNEPARRRGVRIPIRLIIALVIGYVLLQNGEDGLEGAWDDLVGAVGEAAGSFEETAT